MNPISKAQVCRLCLETKDDSLNVFNKFQNSTIATILTKHFCFLVDRNDDLSEWLCQICWRKTEEFHHFYTGTEVCHVNDRRSNELKSADSMKDEPNCDPSTELEVLEMHFDSVKNDEADPSPPAQKANSLTSDEGNSFDFIDDTEDNSNLSSSYDKSTRSIPDENSLASASNKNSHSLSEKEEESVRIREFFTMKCDIWNKVEFDSLLEARRHYIKVHNVKGYLMCCGKKFWRRLQILNHIHHHVNPNGYRCHYCDKSFSSKNSLKGHFKTHIPVDSRAHKCSLCSSSFTEQWKLWYHMRNKHSDETFPCDKCKKSFRSKLSLASHVKNIHEFSLDHVCEICARRFKAKQLLQSHITSEHSTTQQPKAQCNFCGAWLKHERCLRIHIKSMHQGTDSKPVKCTICDQMIKSKSALTQHIRRAHGERRHQCTLCDKTFKRPTNLKEHIAWHTGEYLYNCPYCEKKFKSSANMYSHRKKVHLVEYTRDSALLKK